MVAVRDLCLGSKLGEVLGILGANGAGKSTSMSMLLGELKPSSGCAYLGPQNVTTSGNRSLAFVSSCPQTNPLSELLTGTSCAVLCGGLLL